MATLTIRNIDSKLKEKLRVRAARHGHSMEAELRQILRDAFSGAGRREPEPNLAEAIRRRFQPLDGVDDLETQCPLSHRPSTDDRAGYECALGTDAFETASGSGLPGWQPNRATRSTQPASIRPRFFMESPHCQKADGASLLSLQPFSEEFAERVLPFDGTAAVHYAEIVVARRRIGNPIEAFDAQIAATAPAVRASVATRDIGGFDGCGVTLIDPWNAT